MSEELKGSFTTNYDKEDSGKVKFALRQDCTDEIEQYIELVDQVKETAKEDPGILAALDEIRYNLNSLLYSEKPEAEVKELLKKYSRVPIGDGKFMHLSSFVSSKGKANVVESKEQYIGEVKKMVNNTMSNLTNLILFKEDDETLKAFFDDLNEVKDSEDYDFVKEKMDGLAKNGVLQNYNEVKLSFLKSWLAPYEEKLNKSVEEMSPQDIQSAIIKVEDLKKQELEEIGLKMNSEETDQFRPFNRTMHELMNGENTTFWGYAEYRDEFVELVKSIINRFSFKLENHYITFESEDKNLVYLTGFSDDVFNSAKKLKDNQVGLTPHLKILMQVGEEYKELNQSEMDSAEYFRILKTATVPFLVSLATILGTELSDGLKDSFEMWI